jgi:hypothetical protein
MSEDPSVIYDFDPRNLPPELLQALGLVTAAAAQTESIVQRFIGGLLAIDEIETISLTAQMSANLREQVVRSVLELNAANSWVVDTVDDLMDAIAVATDRRNQLVHTSMARNPETGEVFSVRFKARRSLNLDMDLIDVSQIEKDAAEIYEAGMKLMQFMMMFGILPADRTRPIREELDRRPKARKLRQAEYESARSKKP